MEMITMNTIIRHVIPINALLISNPQEVIPLMERLSLLEGTTL